MEVFILYFIISGVIYTSWLWDKKNSWFNLFIILAGFSSGCIFMPILIGRALKQIYKD